MKQDKNQLKSALGAANSVSEPSPNNGRSHDGFYDHVSEKQATPRPCF